MNAETLSEVMGGALPLSRYQELLPGYVNAAKAAGITNPNRAAMWAAQLGSVSPATDSACEQAHAIRHRQPTRLLGARPLECQHAQNHCASDSLASNYCRHAVEVPSLRS